MTKNQFTKYTTTFAIIGGLGLVSVAGVISASAHGILGNPNKNPEVQKALIAKDLNGYKQAVLAEKTQATQAKLDTLTQDNLNTMSDNYTKMQALHTKMIEAIKTGDKLDDYKSAIKDQKTLRDTMHLKMESVQKPDNNLNKPARKPRPEPTEAQIEARYNQQVAQYKKDGTLPEMGNKEEGKRIRGNHGGRGR